MHHFEEPLGVPDLQVAGLRLWVHGRQFPTADDYWDGNWLQVTVYCGAPGASVWVTGPILHVPDIAHFVRGVQGLAVTPETRTKFMMNTFRDLVRKGIVKP